MHNFANIFWKVFLFLILACRGSPKKGHTKLVFLQRAQKMRSDQMTLMAETVHLYPEDEFTLILFLDHIYLMDEGKGLRLTNNLNINKNKQNEQNTFR